jgi:hypothetical protein
MGQIYQVQDRYIDPDIALSQGHHFHLQGADISGTGQVCTLKHSLQARVITSSMGQMYQVQDRYSIAHKPGSSLPPPLDRYISYRKSPTGRDHHFRL